MLLFGHKVGDYTDKKRVGLDNIHQKWPRVGLPASCFTNVLTYIKIDDEFCSVQGG